MIPSHVGKIGPKQAIPLKRSLVLRRVLLTFGLRRWLGTENPPNLAWVWRISRNILSTSNRFRINRAKYNKWSLKTGNDALSLYDFQKSNTQKQGGGPTRLYYESFLHILWIFIYFLLEVGPPPCFWDNETQL